MACHGRDDNEICWQKMLSFFFYAFIDMLRLQKHME